MKIKELTHELAGARWIAASAISESPIITRMFQVTADQVTSGAEIYITGLGYFEAMLNDKPITEYVLTPLPSDYLPRDYRAMGGLTDELTHRIYVCRYDISGLLQEGENVLTIQLGNGWYRQNERYIAGEVSFGDILRVLYCIQLEGQAVVSDGSETWHNSHLTYNNIFIGEVWNMIYTDHYDKPVRVLEDFEVPLCEQIGAPDRIIRRIKPVFLHEKNGARIYDVGENISGVVQVHTKTARGKRIVLRFAEELSEDGGLDVLSSGGQYLCKSERLQTQTDVFISDGEEQSFMPKFVWHAFRYFEVQGDIEDVTVMEIHSDAMITAGFESSSEGLNFLYDAFLRTQLGNMHGSFPSDCPHRERLGYTGDGQLCVAAGMRMLDGKAFYRKWIQDILDCQNLKNGHIQHTAPFANGGGGPGGWGSSVVIVPYEYYKQYGDKEILKLCYPAMCRYIDYMLSRTDDGLVTREEEQGWCLGDWCTLETCVIPPAYVNTYYLIKSLQLIQYIEAVLGIDKHTAEYAALEKEYCENLIRHYRDASGHFCEGIQGADAYAIDLGIAEPHLIEELAEKYEHMGHLDVGHYGVRILFDVLFKYGKQDVALKLLESEEPGSYLYMKRKGATTLWEEWGGPNSHWKPGEGSCSHFHPVFGNIAYHMLSSVLGITQPEYSAGYEELIVEPHIPEGLTHAKGFMDTVKGRVTVDYRLENGQKKFMIILPENGAYVKAGTAVFVCQGQRQVLKPGENYLTA